MPAINFDRPFQLVSPLGEAIQPALRGYFATADDLLFVEADSLDDLITRQFCQSPTLLRVEDQARFLIRSVHRWPTARVVAISLERCFNAVECHAAD